jgi:phage gp36-like protein
MFIDKTDIIKEIRTEELDVISRYDDTLVQFGIDAAIAEMKSYLARLFLVDLIFSQTGSNRHPLLVNFAVDIAIYVMVSTAQPGQDLEDRRARYKRAIDWLKQVKSGEITSDLPPVTDNGLTIRGKVGEHTKRNNYY